MSDDAVVIGTIISAISLFLGKFFGFLEFSFSKRERDAKSMVMMSDQLIESNKQALESNRQTNVLAQSIITIMERQDSEREMYRARDKERDEQHNAQIKSLEKSLIDSQEELKDTREQVAELQKIVDILKRDNEKQHRDAITKATEDAAIIATQEKELAHLRKRVTELEQELAQVKAQQSQPAPIPVLVAAIGATDAPLKTTPEPGTVQEAPERRESEDADAPQ